MLGALTSAQAPTRARSLKPRGPSRADPRLCIAIMVAPACACRMPCGASRPRGSGQ